MDIRKLTRLWLEQLVVSYNMFKLDILKGAQDNQLAFHVNPSDAISTANASVGSSGASSILLVNAERTAIIAHIASYCDGVTFGIHYGEDTVDIITAPVATDLTSAYTLANDIKIQYNAHLSYDHQYEDVTNVVTATDATTEASLVTLVNQIKAKANSHFAASMLSPNINSVNP